MKVNLFRENDPIAIEEEINDWLAKNPDIVIKQIKQTDNLLIDLSITTTISIWYEMKEEETPSSVNFFINREQVEIEGNRITGKIIKQMAGLSSWQYHHREVWKVDGHKIPNYDIKEALQILDDDEITIKEGDRFSILLKGDS